MIAEIISGSFSPLSLASAMVAAIVGPPICVTAPTCVSSKSRACAAVPFINAAAAAEVVCAPDNKNARPGPAQFLVALAVDCVTGSVEPPMATQNQSINARFAASMTSSGKLDASAPSMNSAILVAFFIFS